MESAGLVRTSVIYRSDNNSFYKDEFVGLDGITRFFYCLISGHDAYQLSEMEGKMLESVIDKSYKKCGCEGIEIELLDFSSRQRPECMN